MDNRRIYTRTCDCGECKKCKQREAQKRWQAANPERAKAIAKRTYQKNKERRSAEVKIWQAANPDKTREIKRRYHVKSRFGLEWDEYQKLLAVRGDVCWICGSNDPKSGRVTMCVDHDHQTGAIRGLLCGDCNNGLARFHDDPTTLRSALLYLAADLT